MSAGMDGRALALARALSDPCNAPLEPGVYPGQTGFITRFAQSYTISLSAAQTAFMVAVAPGPGISFGGAATDLATATAFAAFNTYVPGSSFSTTNAKSQRCLGACFEFFTNATPLNAQGTFYYGVVPYSVPSAYTVATALNSIVPTLQHMSKVNADAYELKFRPGILDSAYSTPNTPLTSAEVDDKNALVLVGGGFPASSTITIKVTLVMEWLPNIGLSLSTPVGIAPPSVHTVDSVLHTLDSAAPSWWAGRVGDAARFVWKHGGEQLASFASNLGTRAAAKYMLGAAARAAPLMIA